MAKSVGENLTSLRLTATDVREQNPQWSDEMVRDYIAIGEDSKTIAKAVDDLLSNLSSSLIKQNNNTPAQIQQTVNRLESSNIDINTTLVLSERLTLRQKELSESSYARLKLDAFSSAVDAASTALITGFTGIEQNFTTTTSSITPIKSKVRKACFSCSIDADHVTNVTVELYKNGVASGIKNTITTYGGAGVSDEYSHVGFNQPILSSKNDVFTVNVSHNSGVSVTIELINIQFGMS